MKEVKMSFAQALKITETFKDEVLEKGKLTIKTEKEKAILLDALGFMSQHIEDEMRRIKLQKQWDSFTQAK